MNEYKFTEHWFDDQKENWTKAFEAYGKCVYRVLEIGCFEGKATTWLCENILTEAIYDVVDTFDGSEIEAGMTDAVKKLKQDENFIENNFKHNISFFNDRIDFHIYKGTSQHVLPQLYSLGNKYDFIYVDASHKADDTFVDSYWANKMLVSGGLIIFDDWGWKDPADMSANNSPEVGIKQFCTLYENDYQMLFHGYQIGLIKK
jgi:predicted O-methyltransferase YrrM